MWVVSSVNYKHCSKVNHLTEISLFSISEKFMNDLSVVLTMYMCILWLPFNYYFTTDDKLGRIIMMVAIATRKLQAVVINNLDTTETYYRAFIFNLL